MNSDAPNPHASNPPAQPPLPGLAAVAEVVSELAELFVAAGKRLYLVGGVVRDLALGAHAVADDIDLTTDADPTLVKELVRPRATALWTQGERFGTIGATVNGRDLEITTHRAEAYDHTSRKPVVAFGTSIEDDLVRRDFTMNAMAVSLPDRRLVDPFGGLADLDRRHLVTPLAPVESFADDPLRMLRAARFVARFDLTVDPELERAATRLASRLAIVSVERVQGELDRLLALPSPAAGLDLLVRTGLLGRIITPYGEGAQAGAEPDAVAVAGVAATVAARRAGLLLPLGAGAGAELRRLRYPRAVTRQTVDLIAAHPVAVSAAPSAADVRSVVADIGRDALGELRALTDATHPGTTHPGTSLPFWTRLAELEANEDLDQLGSPLPGRRIMEHLGLGPGPEVGLASRHLRRLRIEHGPMSEAEALSALDSWAAAGPDAAGDGSPTSPDDPARQEDGGAKG
ncbi:MAG: CCA tRNA nucleotidyltransferase [Actinomycetota bacterium]